MPCKNQKLFTPLIMGRGAQNLGFIKESDMAQLAGVQLKPIDRRFLERPEQVSDSIATHALQRPFLRSLMLVGCRRECLVQRWLTGRGAESNRPRAV